MIDFIFCTLNFTSQTYTVKRKELNHTERKIVKVIQALKTDIPASKIYFSLLLNKLINFYYSFANVTHKLSQKFQYYSYYKKTKRKKN